MNQTNAIRQPWLSLVRLVWVILASYNALPGLLRLPDYYRQLVRLDPFPNQSGWTQATFSAAVSRTGLEPQIMAWIVMLPVLVEILVFLSMGIIIFWRKSNEWQGLLVSFVLVGLCGTFTLDRFQFLKALPPVWQVVGSETGKLIWVAFFMFLILFPDGRFVPSWMRWVALGVVAWIVLTEGIGLIFKTTPVILFFLFLPGFVFLALIVAGMISRYRRLSSLTERQQIRWFLFALLVFVIYQTLQIILVRIFPIPPQPGPLDVAFYLVEVYLTNLSFILIPIAIGIAIFRYRLWDIDLIIRRTLVFGVLSGALALIYWGGVTLLQGLFTHFTGQQSPASTVISTLLIAALFSPLRRRVQGFIDRRFFRRRYNAGQVVDRFVAQTRLQADLAEISGKLLETVNDVVEPQAISLWLPGETISPAAPGLRHEKS